MLWIPEVSKRFKTFSWGLLAAITVGACAEHADYVGVNPVDGEAQLSSSKNIASVTVTPSVDTLLVSTTLQLTAITTDASGATRYRTVTWASADSSLATVSASGLVLGLRPGSVTISASASGKTGTSRVTVVAPAPPVPPTPPSVAVVSVTPGSTALLVGATEQLTATARDSAGNVLSGFATTWTSSNTAIAAVSATGLVTAMAAGNATITAISGGRSGTAAVTVTAPPPPPTGFTPGNILNNASFDAGWDGFMDGGSGVPTGVNRDAGQFYGTSGYSAHKTLTAGDTRDETSSMRYAFYYRNGQNGYVTPGHGVDRLYSRFWIKVDRTFNGTILKLQMFQVDGFSKFAEFAFFQNYLVFGYAWEWGGGNVRIVPLSALNDGQWHSIESDVQFNGNIDAGGDYISTAIWFDGVDVSIAAPPVVGGSGNVALGRWVNGRINAGSRAANNTGTHVGVWSGPNVLNANNPVAGNLWMDRVSISTLGRVGQ